MSSNQGSNNLREALLVSSVFDIDLSQSRTRNPDSSSGVRRSASRNNFFSHSSSMASQIASTVSSVLGAKEGSKASFWIFFGCNFLTTGVSTFYVFAQLLTKASGLPSTFLQVSPWAILMGMPGVLFFSYSEARAHDAQSRQLHNGPSKESLYVRLKALSLGQRTCLPIYFSSHVLSDVQTLLLIAQLAGFSQLSWEYRALVYCVATSYGMMANVQEFKNTLQSFEELNKKAFQLGPQHNSRLSCSRLGFIFSNLLITAINTGYVCSHLLGHLNRLINNKFFDQSILDVSYGSMALSVLPVLAFSISVAKASDAQSQQLTEDDSSDSSSSGSGALGVFERFKKLSYEQEACVLGHYLSEVFGDIQSLVLLLSFSAVDQSVSLPVLLVIYLAMFSYGFVTDYQIIPNAIAGFEGENGAPYRLPNRDQDSMASEFDNFSDVGP